MTTTTTIQQPTTPEPVLTSTVDLDGKYPTAHYTITASTLTNPNGEQFSVWGSEAEGFIVDTNSTFSEVHATFEDALVAANIYAGQRMAALRPFDFPQVGDVLRSHDGDLLVVESVTSSDGTTADRFTAVCRPEHNGYEVCRTEDRTYASDWTAHSWFAQRSAGAWLTPVQAADSDEAQDALRRALSTLVDQAVALHRDLEETLASVRDSVLDNDERAAQARLERALRLRAGLAHSDRLQRSLQDALAVALGLPPHP